MKPLTPADTTSAAETPVLEIVEIERLRAEQHPPWQPDPECYREMAWYHSYIELWGVMRPIRASYQAGGWAHWVLWTMAAAQLVWLARTFR